MTAESDLRTIKRNVLSDQRIAKRSKQPNYQKRYIPLSVTKSSYIRDRIANFLTTYAGKYRHIHGESDSLRRHPNNLTVNTCGIETKQKHDATFAAINRKLPSSRVIRPRMFENRNLSLRTNFREQTSRFPGPTSSTIPRLYG